MGSMACDLRTPTPADMEHIDKAMQVLNEMNEDEVAVFISQFDDRATWNRLNEPERLVVQMARCWNDPAQRDSVTEWATEAIVAHETERGISLIEQLLSEPA